MKESRPLDNTMWGTGGKGLESFEGGCCYQKGMRDFLKCLNYYHTLREGSTEKLLQSHVNVIITPTPCILLTKYG